MHDLSVTIVAVATPPGRGGIGCVRISGPQAWTIAERLFRPARRSRAGEARTGQRAPDLAAVPARRDPGSLRFGRFVDRDGSALDHGYAVRFAAGGSYTGEPTAEMWTHGSPAVLAELVAAAVAAGAEPAGPGEFTYRALRHGRLDLARAEAVRDLVAARTVFQARVAFAQAEGALSRRLAPLRERLAELIARGEAAVEFVDESETHLPGGQLEGGIASALDACRSLLADYRTGRWVREGASLVITGLPNAGKSSLFNRLLARERAIVTEIPGTTRDTLEEAIQLDGIPVTVIDTAGLRDVDDPIEREGVRRAEAAREEADLVLLVLDGSARELRPAERDALAAIDGAVGGVGDPAACRPGRSVVVVNKMDLPGAADRPLPHPEALRVSASTGEGIESLRRALRERLVGEGPLEDPILTDARHARAMEAALAALERAAEAQASGLSEELVLEDLREAMQRLGRITGEFGGEELYDRIFSTFCIGK